MATRKVIVGNCRWGGGPTSHLADNPHIVFQALRTRYTRVRPSSDVQFQYLAHHNLILGLSNHSLWRASRLEEMYHHSRAGSPWFQKKISSIIFRNQMVQRNFMSIVRKRTDPKKKRTMVAPNCMNIYARDRIGRSR